MLPCSLPISSFPPQPVQFMEDHGFDPYYGPEEMFGGGGEWGWEGDPYPMPPVSELPSLTIPPRQCHTCRLSPYPLQPRNPHDDKLVLNKHGSIFPQDTEVSEMT